MSEYCELFCGTPIHYDKIKFSDGFVLRIAREKDNKIHECPTLPYMEKLFSNYVIQSWKAPLRAIPKHPDENVSGEEAIEFTLGYFVKNYTKTDEDGNPIDEDYKPAKEEFMNDLGYNPILLWTDIKNSNKFSFNPENEKYIKIICENIRRTLWDKDTIQLSYQEAVLDSHDFDIKQIVSVIREQITLFENIKNVLNNVAISPNNICYPKNIRTDEFDSCFTFLKYFYTQIKDNEMDKKNIYELQREFEENLLKLLESKKHSIDKTDYRRKDWIEERMKKSIILIRESEDFLSSFNQEFNEPNSLSSELNQNNEFDTPETVRAYIIDKFEPKFKEYFKRKISKHNSKIKSVVPKIYDKCQDLIEKDEMHSLKINQPDFIDYCTIGDLINIIKNLGFDRCSNRCICCKNCKGKIQQNEIVIFDCYYTKFCKPCSEKRKLIIDYNFINLFKMYKGLVFIRDFRNDFSHKKQSTHVIDREYNDKIDKSNTMIVKNFMNTIELEIRYEEERAVLK